MHRLAAIVAASLALVCAGCNPVPVSSRPPAASMTAGPLQIEQAGAAAVPASGSTHTARQSVPLPAASTLTYDAEKPGSVTIRLSRDSVFSAETQSAEVEGPQAFTPPAPPTPQDEADGRAMWVYRIGLVVGIAAALFGLVRDWDFVMWGGAAVAAACAFGIFVQRHPALFAVMGGGVAVAAAGVGLWHLKLKRLPTPAA